MRLPTSFLSLSLFTTLLLLLTLFSHPTTSLGINCRGSYRCGVPLFLPPNNNAPLGAMSRSCATSINLNRQYLRGEHIACAQAVDGGAICLFMQGDAVPVEGIRGVRLCGLLRELVRHGCQHCGSVPLSGDNNPDVMGELTGNYVLNPSCVGWCRSVV